MKHFEQWWKQVGEASIREYGGQLSIGEVRTLAEAAWTDSGGVQVTRLFLILKGVLKECKASGADASATRVAIMEALIDFAST